MPATRTREAARERVRQVFESALDRVIPLDPGKPLRGSIFADFENQAYGVGNPVVTTLMEERAKLELNASVCGAGRCPHCGAERTYLEQGRQSMEVRSPSGAVVIEKQNARCRACDGSFSPSNA